MRYRRIFLASILLIAFILSPLSLVSIQGNSMDPTITSGSLLVTYETHNVAVDDIVTFYSEQTEGFVTHRITETTDNGLFITLGDNNAVTDQEIGIKPLAPSDITSKAVEFNGEPVYIPYLGQLFTIFGQNLLLLTSIGFGVLGFIYTVQQRVNSRRVYSEIVAKDIFQPIFAVALAMLILLFMFNATLLSVPFVYTSEETAAQQQYVLYTGDEIQQETITINSSSSWYTDKLYVTEGFEPITIDETINQTIINSQLPTRANPGSYETTVSIYTVPAVLPQSLAQQTATISPVIPVTASSLILIAPFYLIYRFYIGPNTPSRNPRISKVLSRIE